MKASDHFKAGRLQQAIDAQIAEVKANPADPARRLFLFELLAFTGDLDRMRRQLAAVRYDDLEKDNVIATYLKLLDAEEARQRVLQGKERPVFFVEPPAHVELRLSALALLHQNRADEARTLLEQANAATPSLRGVLNGKPFTALRDEDDRFGPILEVLALGKYHWLPLEQLDILAMNAPKTVRDLRWAPVWLQVRGGPEGHGHVPVLYPGSSGHTDDAVRLGRLTDWTTSDEGPLLGLGQHSFLADDDPIGLLQWRQLELEDLNISSAPSEGPAHE